jgi:hypothetical protein
MVGNLSLVAIDLDNRTATIAYRVAELCGYRFEGVKRGGYRADDGVRWDAHVHARLDTDPAP